MSHFGLRRKITSLVALGACLLAGAVSADAQTVCVGQGQSKTFTYKPAPDSPGLTTATFTLEHDVLTVQYKNIAVGAFLTGIGVNASPQVTLESDSSATATNGWRAGAGPGGGLGSFDLIAYGNGSKARLAPGLSGKATFTLAFAQPEVCIEQTVVHLTGLAGSSSKPGGVLTAQTVPGAPTPDSKPIYID